MLFQGNVSAVTSEQMDGCIFSVNCLSLSGSRLDNRSQNLTDKDPPLLAGFATQSNTDPSIFDVYGRRYFMGVTARF
jgi:hypothetical protein